MDYFRPGTCRNYSSNLFINKYSPKTLDEFKGNEGVKETLKSYVESDNPPNLILTGPHGSGKSSLAKLFVQEYLGPGGFSEGCLEIYGSLSRGKDVVSEKQTGKTKQKNFNCPGITNFIKKMSNLPANKLKIVLIYEFHQMSSEAQMALRRTMERRSAKVRFIFLTEDHSQIIQALQSRCTPLQLQKLDSSDIERILKPIMLTEKIPINQELLDIIHLNSDGDIRLATNLLQVLSIGGNTDEWYDILGIPEIKTLQGIIKSCIKKRVTRAYRLIQHLLEQGFEINDLLDLISKVLIRYPDFENKKQFLRILCQDMLTIEECYTETQLYNLINHLASYEEAESG